MELLYHYNWVSNAIALLVGLFLFKKISQNDRPVFWFVTFGVFTELISRFIIEHKLKSTMPVGHFYIPISFTLLSIYYFHKLKTVINAKILIALISGFVIFSIVNILFIQSLFEFPNITGSVGAIILIFFSVLLFHKFMIEAKVKVLSKEPAFWINSGVLIYYSANLFFYAMFNYALKVSKEFLMFTASIFSGFNFLFYIFITIGFFQIKKK